MLHNERDVPSVLKKDGVVNSSFDEANKTITNIPALIASKDSTKSWSHCLVNTESNSCTLICQLPGEGNRLHYHKDWNEWWLILQGEWIWSIDGEDKIIKEGDHVFIEKEKWHKITASGNKPAIRMAVSRYDVVHTYKE